MNKNDGSLIGMEMHRHSTENDSSWLSHDTWCSELLFDGSPNGELFVLQTFFLIKIATRMTDVFTATTKHQY